MEKIKKIKRNLIISIIILSIAFVAVLFFVIFYQAYNMLWTPFIFIIFMVVAILIDRSKIKEIESEDENKPV